MSTPARALRLPSSSFFVVSVARSRKFCAALSLLLTALFALLALPAAQAHAQVVSGSVAVAPVIDTLAGDGTAGSLGDGGSATSAELNAPADVALDSAGNLYIADCNNDRIRVVATTTGTVFGQSVTAGDIYTVAGGGGTPGTFSGDGGPATSAELNSPEGVAFDSAGDLYIADCGNNRIRVVAAKTGTVLGISMTAGDIYTVAGSSSTGGFSGDGGPATSAELNSPEDVALDSAGDLYIADNCNDRIRVVAAKTGTVFGQSMTADDIYTVAGNGAANYSGDGGPATSAELNSPYGVAFDSAGDLYIADWGNNRIRVVAAATGTVLGWGVTADDIYTVAGDGTYGYSGDGGAATSAELGGPSGVAVDSAGRLLYIADINNNRIRKVSANTNTMQPTTAVGASAAPQNVLVELTTASAISSISAPKAQNNVQEFTVGAVTGCTIGSVSNPADTICTVPITFDPQYPGPRAGELTLYSSGSTILGTVGLTGTGTSPLLAFQPAVQSTVKLSNVPNPAAIAVDGAGNLYVVNSNTNATSIVEIPANGGAQITLPFSNVDGPIAVAVDAAGNVYVTNSFYSTQNVVKLSPQGAQSIVPTNGLNAAGGITIDTAGDVYIADSGNNRVVKVTAAGTQTTLPFTGLNDPQGLALDAAGNLYVADYFNNRVVKLTPAGVQSVVASGLGQPTGVAIDGAGDIYVANNLDQDIVEITPQNQAQQTPLTLPTTTLDTPSGVAVDAAGNVYIDDVGLNAVYEIHQSQARPINFPTTTVGQSSLPAAPSLQNIGNQPLTLDSFTGVTTGQATSSFATSSYFITCDLSSPLAPEAYCTLGIEFTPTVAGSLIGFMNIADNSMNAIAPNNVQQIPLSGTGTAPAAPPNVSIALSPSSLPVTPGASGSLQVTLTPSGNYAGTVTLACSGLPSKATCAFSPSSVIFTSSSSAAQTVTLTVATTAATAALRPYAPFGSQSKGSLPILATVFWLPGLLAAGAGLRKRKSGVTSHAHHMLVLLVLLAGVGLLTACGSSSGSSTSASTPGTPAGTSTVTVTVSGTNSLSNSATFTLIVQ